jgi:iron complex outermembrane receptor protein
LFQTVAIAPAPSSVSFVNLKDANLINSGVELALGATIIDRKSLTWDFNFNIAYNKNNIKNFTDPNTGKDNFVQTGPDKWPGSIRNIRRRLLPTTNPVNAYYLKPFNGFKGGDQQIGDNPVFRGDPNPRTLAGFSSTVRYNKLSFILNMGGAFGFLIYNNTATAVTNINGISKGRNIDLSAYNSEEASTSAVGASTRFLEKGDYLNFVT